MRCVRCYSYAINHAQHGRDGSDGDLCDVCYWRARAEYPAAAARVPLTDEQIVAALRLCDAEDHTQDGWVLRQRIKWARAIEKAHGITGGEA